MNCCAEISSHFDCNTAGNGCRFCTQFLILFYHFFLFNALFPFLKSNLDAFVGISLCIFIIFSIRLVLSLCSLFLAELMDRNDEYESLLENHHPYDVRKQLSDLLIVVDGILLIGFIVSIIQGVLYIMVMPHIDTIYSFLLIVNFVETGILFGINLGIQK